MPESGPGRAPDIVVTVPFYRDLALLEQALRSVVAQTDRAWRAVVVDDGSPIGGVEGVLRAIDDPRITSVRNDTTLGVAENFNRCLAAAAELAADVAVILHADDLLEPGFVAGVRAAHVAHPSAAAVATRVTVVDGAGRPSLPIGDRVKRAMWPRGSGPHQLRGDRGLARTLTGLFWYCPAMSYRLDALPELRWDPRWQQVMDLDLYGRMLLDDATILLLDEALYRYRRHAGTMTAQNSASMLRSIEERRVLDELTAAARARGWRWAVAAGRLRATHRGNAALMAASALRRGDTAHARTAAALAAGRA
jgi:glycosyltransferase involved in cell wall biosynthesis